MDTSPIAHCFALLDDCDATASDRRSRLYTGHAGTLLCQQADQLPALWEQMQQALHHGKWAVALFTYELGAGMADIAPYSQGQSPFVSRVLLFDRCERLSSVEVDAWLKEQASETAHAGILRVQANVDESGFHQALGQIHTYIEAGDTYQVNYTYRVRFDAYGPVAVLYRRLRQRQSVPYGALIVLPEGGTVLSFSPELFVRHAQGRLVARPMKGTAAASGDSVQDAECARVLAADLKNRAENLMIVDLLRNDLGRIAVPGSVRVPHLFQVNRHGSVLQMTSTVQADMRDGMTLAQIFSALYPCGSITGAPKRRTMQIIRELEQDPRGVYTGAIGWFDAPAKGYHIGDFCLSVPIRTLALQTPGENGMRTGEMGVGAGIVHDSIAQDEYRECQLKAHFLTDLPVDFALLESLYATREEGCRYLDLHMQRLRSSSAYFGFSCDEAEVRRVLQNACSGLAAGPHRLRLTLNQAGVCTVHSAALLPVQEPVTVLIAQQQTVADDVFLHHKTTVRERYDAAWRVAEARGAFDMLFCNTRGELTEGARSNVFVKCEGRWHTPPLTAGVLPGVMRSVLLGDQAWSAQEKKLTLNDLREAEEIVVCNALRGILTVRVQWD